MTNPLGGFTAETLEAYQKALAEQAGTDFAEGDSYDFTTCIRPDGSAYGTGGKCRKGTEGEAKAKEPKVKAAAKKPEQSLGEMAAARKKLSDTWQDKRVAARNAEIEHDRVSKLTKGDNSPEARAQRLKAATAADKAQQARDRAQRAWMKMNDKLDAAMERQPAKRSEAQDATTRALEMVRANARAQGLTEIKAGGSKPSPNLPLKEAGDAFRRALRENQPREAVKGYDWRKQSGTFNKADNE